MSTLNIEFEPTLYTEPPTSVRRSVCAEQTRGLVETAPVGQLARSSMCEFTEAEDVVDNG